MATTQQADDDGAPPAARPRGEKIVEADAIMLEALTGLRQLQIAGQRDQRRPRELLEMLVRLIRQYPHSDQVDDACFHAAEILREYLNEFELACEFYRRAYLADPATSHPARFQRAALLDFRLNRPAEALAEYRQVILLESQHDAGWANSNARFAAARIKALSVLIEQQPQ